MDITLILIKAGVVIESVLFATYIFAVYLLYTSGIKNGLGKALGATFFTGLLYNLAIIVSLFLFISKYYSIMSALPEASLVKSLVYLLVFSRLLITIARFYLAHELRVNAAKTGVDIANVNTN